MTPALARRWITVQETAKYTHLSPPTVRGLIARGVIPAFRLGRLVRVDLRALKKRDSVQILATKFKAGGRPC